MAKCDKCREKAVFTRPTLCKLHFIQFFENKAHETILKHHLLMPGDRVAVAASGGKDSTSLLYLLKKFNFNADAIAVDEGIAGYRDKTLADLKEFCEMHRINLKVCSYEGEFGDKLDSLLNHTDKIPCSVCGPLRRYLLNKMARGYDKVATGHNMDDEVQSIMMNLSRNSLEMNARLGPRSGMREQQGFVQRIKPLYFCSEREVMAYSFLMGFNVSFNECPHVPDSFRARMRDALNEYEFNFPGTKETILETFLSELPTLRQKFTLDEDDLKSCISCGEPSQGEKCRVCELTEKMINHSAPGSGMPQHGDLLQVRG